MKLSNSEKAVVGLALMAASSTPKFMGAVLDVLYFGDTKHGHDDFTADDHIQSALAHLRAGDSIEVETLKPSRAHAAARVILAFLKLCRESDSVQYNEDFNYDGDN